MKSALFKVTGMTLLMTALGGMLLIRGRKR
jgi:hypothetical protein